MDKLCSLLFHQQFEMPSLITSYDLSSTWRSCLVILTVFLKTSVLHFHLD